MIIAEVIGWIATAFRGAGMLAKGIDTVKYLVSIGNLFWLINGILTNNKPLIASNGFCLVIMLWNIFKTRNEKPSEYPQDFINIKTGNTYTAIKEVIDATNSREGGICILYKSKDDASMTFIRDKSEFLIKFRKADGNSCKGSE